MNQREAEGHYGAALFIYQCPECLGLWVDGDTVAALSHDSALQAETDVDFADISVEPREIELLCPRCAIHMMEQTGGGLPKDLRIDYCKSCNGFWFDKGELMIYKSHLENKRKKFRDREEEKRRKRAIQSKQPLTSGAMVLKFLNTKIHRYGL